MTTTLPATPEILAAAQNAQVSNAYLDGYVAGARDLAERLKRMRTDDLARWAQAKAAEPPKSEPEREATQAEA
jgi:hypothetical protein